eukprot:TRINITY_DN22903_c0_g1_i1.p1 TRINITY_DN22903_c0_g1~~TRINITY_DN22903_c0_g1_i1.p1  ORF type:complete len:913 (+),score=179.51 TRINITY_DN22903_c0_g1_i1:169-2907(+)
MAGSRHFLKRASSSLRTAHSPNRRFSTPPYPLQREQSRLQLLPPLARNAFSGKARRAVLLSDVVLLPASPHFPLSFSPACTFHSTSSSSPYAPSSPCSFSFPIFTPHFSSFFSSRALPSRPFAPSSSSLVAVTLPGTCSTSPFTFVAPLSTLAKVSLDFLQSPLIGRRSLSEAATSALDHSFSERGDGSERREAQEQEGSIEAPEVRSSPEPAGTGDATGERHTGGGGRDGQQRTVGHGGRGKRRRPESKTQDLWNYLRYRLAERTPIQEKILAWCAERRLIISHALCVSLLIILRDRGLGHEAVELAHWIVTGGQFTSQLTPHDYRALLDLCCRFNRASRGEQYYARFPLEYHTEEMYGFLLHYYARRGNFHKVESKLQVLLNEGITPGVITYGCRLLAYAQKLRMDKAEEVWAEMKEKGLPPSLENYKVMLEGYGLLQKFDKMRQVYDDMVSSGIELDALTFNTLAWHYLLAGKEEEGLAMIEACREYFPSCLPRSSLQTMMWAYSRLGQADKMEKVAEEMKERGLLGERQVAMARMFGFGQAGNVQRAKEVFDEVMQDEPRRPLNPLYNCMLAAYTVNGQMAEAEELMTKMRQIRVRPDSVGYEYMLRGYLANGDSDAAFDLLREIADHPDRRYLKPPFPVFKELVARFVAGKDLAKVDEVMREGGKLFKTDPTMVNMWLEAYVTHQEKAREENEERERRSGAAFSMSHGGDGEGGMGEGGRDGKGGEDEALRQESDDSSLVGSVSQNWIAVSDDGHVKEGEEGNEGVTDRRDLGSPSSRHAESLDHTENSTLSEKERPAGTGVGESQIKPKRRVLETEEIRLIVGEMLQRMKRGRRAPPTLETFDLLAKLECEDMVAEYGWTREGAIERLGRQGQHLTSHDDDEHHEQHEEYAGRSSGEKLEHRWLHI